MQLELARWYGKVRKVASDHELFCWHTNFVVRMCPVEQF